MNHNKEHDKIREEFFKNYQGRYSSYWIERWGLIPELPTSFDNANSMYELVAWLQRAFKNLLDDFQQLEAESEDFKNALIELLEYLIPELTRRYHDSAEYRTLFITLLEDILSGEERTWVKDLLKELIEIDMREWIEVYLKDLYGLELNETNTQLAQIASVTTMGVLNEEIPLTNKTRINTYGFYETSSNTQFSYAVVENTTLENWVDTGNGYEINEEMALKVNNKVKLVPLFKDEIKAGAIGLEGDSDIVFQMLLDYAYKNKINIDMTGCKVTMSNTLFLNKPQHPRKLLLIKNGWIVKENGGVLFDNPPENAGSGGGYRFVNTVFEGVEGTDLTLFDSKIIRVYLDACEFYNVDNLFKSFDNKHYLQSIYVTNAYIVGGKGHVFDSLNGYDILFDSSLVEHRTNYMRIDTPHSVRTTNSVIEGMTGYVYRGKYGRSLVFDDNYFEANCTGNNEPYFKFTNYNGRINPFSVSMQSNLIQGNDPQQNKPDFYMVEFDGVPNTISFNGTWSNCNLVKVAKINTLTNKKLRKMLSGHTGNKKVVNEWGNVDVLEGSGTMIPLAINSGLNLFTQVGTGEVKNTSSGVMFTAQALNTVGIELNTGVPSHPNTYYVVGLSLSNYQQLSRGYFTVAIIDSNNTILQEYRLPLSEIAVNENFLSLPPVYTANTLGRLKIRLSIEDTSGGSFLLKSLVFQQGTIANPYQIYG